MNARMDNVKTIYPPPQTQFAGGGGDIIKGKILETYNNHTEGIICTLTNIYAKIYAV